MKDKALDEIPWALSCIAAFGLGLLVGMCAFSNKTTPELLEQGTSIEEVQPEAEPTLDEHIAMIVPDKLQDICKAIIWVESRNNPEAYRASGNCRGILQITPIYVKECNRLQSDITYTLEDRTDIVKSLEMFTIYQNKHNPSHDIHRAIEVHNPTAGPDYRDRVMRKLNTIY